MPEPKRKGADTPEVEITATAKPTTSMFLRECVLQVHDGDDRLGELSISGATLVLGWREDRATISLADILRSWVAAVAPEDADKIASPS